MVDATFSSVQFEGLGLNTEAARDLADLLQEKVLSEVHAVALKKFEEIIARLNAMGHNLCLYSPPMPGDIAYRDDWQDETGYHCKLQLGLDIVVSAGYSHTKPS